MSDIKCPFKIGDKIQHLSSLPSPRDVVFVGKKFMVVSYKDNDFDTIVHDISYKHWKIWEPECPFKIGDTVYHRNAGNFVVKNIERHPTINAWLINGHLLHEDDPTSIYRLTKVDPPNQRTTWQFETEYTYPAIGDRFIYGKEQYITVANNMDVNHLQEVIVRDSIKKIDPYNSQYLRCGFCDHTYIYSLVNGKAIDYCYRCGSNNLLDFDNRFVGPQPKF